MSTALEPAVVNFAPEPGSVELREVSPPSIGPDDVLLEVAAVSVCGSDLHQWTGDQSWPVNYPVVLGHEFCGRIYTLGERVAEAGDASARGWAIGDRVVSETAAVIDPNNPMTRRGLYNLDPTRKGFGYGVDGAMTRYARVPARCLHRLPDPLAFETAALTEPCCVAYNAVIENSDIKPGDRVMVLGPGPIGLLCAIMAKLAGAGEVALVGLQRDAERLAIAAKHYGLTTLVDDGEPQGNVYRWAMEGAQHVDGPAGASLGASLGVGLADGLGVDGVIDAAGVSITLNSAMALTRPAGFITKVGWGPQPLGFSLDPLVQKNLRLQGSFSHNWPIWERVIAMLASGQLNVQPLIGGVWPVTQWKQAFEKMHSGEIVKAVLTPA